jgi:cellulose synthase operon protein YhjQ
LNLLLIGSPKGGVGKTFIAANLAFTMAQKAIDGGHGRVALVDFDPQNSARFHFGQASGTMEGWASRLLRGETPEVAPLETSSGVLLLPYGRVDGRQDQEVSSLLQQRSNWLDGLLAGLAARGASMVLCDLPPGPSPALTMLSARTSLSLHVLLADPASIALLPDIESGIYPGGGTIGLLAARQARFVLNQVDWSFPLSERIARAAAQRLGDRLLGAVCRDTAVMSAMANGKTLVEFAPTAAAARDLSQLTDAVERLMTATHKPVSGGDDMPSFLKGFLS